MLAIKTSPPPLDPRALRESTTKLEGGLMRTFNRILSVVTLISLMSVPALRAQDDRQYDPQTDDQQVTQPDQDQSQADQYSQDQSSQDQGSQDQQSQDQQSQDQQSQDQQSAEATSPPQYPQSGDNQPQQPDPPTRAARLQLMNGSVSVQPHGTDDWVAGQVNRPLTNSDNIWADKNSRAEISVGTGLIRIDSESSLTLTNVSDSMVQLSLHQGAMNLHVRRLYDGETYEVDTPNQAFTIRKPGDYRFDVDPDKDKTVITVWRGEGESTGNGPSVRIHENEQARFTGTSMQNDIHAAPGPDAFDQWASSRDNRLDHSASSRYVSPDVVGSEDLDEYGQWRDTPSYGHVWVPNQVDAGWAPYRNGHWIWVDPWGWTWVEDEPWGYAPFHYGRWVYYDNYWGWAPGPIYVRPYYSPALVAWFGGPGWGVSVGFGGGYGYGWCPLGFGEPYIPWYRSSFGYFNRVNITNTRITNINIRNVYNTRYVNRGRDGGRGEHQFRYANMRARNGFTAVSRDTLVNSRNVARNNIRVSPTQITKVNVTNNINVRPTRNTVLGPNAGRSAAVPPQRSFARPVVSHAAAPQNSRALFNPQSPVARNQGMNGRGMNGNAMNGNGMNGKPSPGRNQELGQNRNAGPNHAGRNNAGPNNAGANNAARNEAGRNNGFGQNQNLGRNQGTAPEVKGAQRPAENNRGATANSNIRMPENRPMVRSNVPRPPGAGGFSGERGMNSAATNGPRSNVATPNAHPESQQRPSSPEMGSRNNVPRPPGNMERGSSPTYSPRGNERQAAPQQSAPRYNERQAAPQQNVPRYNERQTAPQQNAPRSNDRQGGPRAERSAPRPAPSYEADRRPSPSFGGGSNSRPSYDRPNYGGGSYSRPVPSYDRGSSPRSMPSYGGGGGYSRPVPSYGGGGGRSMPSGGGFGGGRAPAPSYGGAGGGHASGGFGGGGGHVSGGGGGHASAPSGGGGHSSGGGGGHNNSGGHGGRH